MRKYLVILEKGEKNWGAYSPDISGVIATSKTRDETLKLFNEALAFHLEGLSLEGMEIPEPYSEADYVAV